MHIDPSQVLVAAAVLVGVFYVFPVVQLRAQLRSPGTPHLAPIGAQQIAQPLGRLMGRVADTLVNAGFTLLGYAEGPMAPTARTGGVRYIAMLLAPDRCTAAMVQGLERSAGDPTFDAQVEFTTRFENGGEVDTNTSTMLGFFIRPPLKAVFSFPDERTPTALYDLHRRLVDRHGRRWQSSPSDPSATLGEGLERIRKLWPEEYERQVAAGIFRRAQGGAYRLTWYGALRGVALLGSPGRQIRAALLRRRAAKLAAELRGLAGPGANS